MIYLADTANIAELKDLYSFFPISGVTTNPSILAREGENISVIIPKVVELLGGDGVLHMQLISEKAEDMLREAKKYRDHFGLGKRFYAKIPITREGFRAISMLKDADLNVTAMAIYTQQQAMVAARAGADFVSPYVSRLDNISSHGIEVVNDIVRSIDNFELESQVLATNFKTVDQIYRICTEGCHAASICYNLLIALTRHPMTDLSIQNFLRDGIDLYDLEF